MSKIPKIKVTAKPKDRYDPNMSFLQLEATDRPTVNVTVQNIDTFTPEQKAKLAWIWSLVQDKRPNFSSSDRNEYAYQGYVGGTGFHMPRLYSGQGMGWLEPFINDGKTNPTNKMQNGVFVSVEAKPAIYGFEWREYSEKNDGKIIKRDVKYGETIQLHVYTDGLYGNEIEIDLMDVDGYDEDLPLHEKDDKGAYQGMPKPGKPVSKKDNYPTFHKKLQREVNVFPHLEDTAIKGNQCTFNEIAKKTKKTLVQKCVTNVYIDPLWSFYVNSESGKEDNSITMKTIIYDLNDKAFEVKIAPEITIKGKTDKPSALEPTGNKAVVVGEIETNVADFFDCRYDKIVLKQQDKSKTTDVFDSSKNEDRRKNPIEIEIVAGKKETYLLDFDLKTTECEAKPQKHLNNELVVYTVPPDYEFTIEAGSNAKHTVKKAETKLYKAESSTKNTVFGVSTTSKETVKTEKGIVKVRQKQLEFDGFYNYDIPQNEQDARVVFPKAFQYFWLPDLGDKIKFISMSANSCAYKKDIKISFYPDIKWTLKFGFNVKKEDIEALNERGLKSPLGIFEALEEGNQRTQEEADKKDKEFMDQNKDLKRIQNKEINETRKKFKLKKKLKKKESESTPEEKGKFAGLIEILKRVTISLSEEHYGGDQSNELSIEFVKQFYNKYQAQFELLAEAADIIEGNKDSKGGSGDPIDAYMKEHGKSVAGLQKKLKRKPTEYEILYPKIALAGSWFYEQIDASQYPALAGRQGLGLDINFSAKPLMGVTIKWDLLELLCRKHPIAYAILKSIDALLYVLADDESAVKCDFSITGKIDTEVKWQHNMLAGFKNLSAKGKSAMQAEVKLELKLAKSIKVAKFAAVVRLGFSAGASIGLGIEDNFGVDNIGVYIQKDLVFEGIKLSFEAEGSGELTSETGDRKKTLASVSKKIEGEITMLAHTFSTDKIYFK